MMYLFCYLFRGDEDIGFGLELLILRAEKPLG